MPNAAFFDIITLERKAAMCGSGSECKHPEKLERKPEECTPEQIKECHGEVAEHPCVKKG